MTANSEVSGVILDGLTPGSLVDVETRSRHYQIECLGGTAIRISGHPEYCPQPTEAQLHSRIGLGEHLVFYLRGGRPVTTSRVLNVHVTKPSIH